MYASRAVRTLGLSFSFVVSACCAAPSFAQDLGRWANLHQQQWDQALQTLGNAQTARAANERVIMIWSNLGAYSGQYFPVLPAETFAAGISKPGYIYLDVSIAGDPELSVTRFFLAHEWGHEVHGDPLVGLISARYHFLTASNTAAEDSADAYAATFMSKEGYDVRPALSFLCNIPDGGPADAHSSGPDRAAHVARVYGYADGFACPTVSNDDLLAKEVRALVNGGANSFAGMTPIHTGMGDYEPIPLTLSGHDSFCDFDSTDPDSCVATISRVTVPSMSKIEISAALESAIDAALPGWTKEPHSYGGGVTWWQHSDDSGENVDLHDTTMIISAH